MSVFRMFWVWTLVRNGCGSWKNSHTYAWSPHWQSLSLVTGYTMLWGSFRTWRQRHVNYLSSECFSRRRVWIAWSYNPSLFVTENEYSTHSWRLKLWFCLVSEKQGEYLCHSDVPLNSFIYFGKERTAWKILKPPTRQTIGGTGGIQIKVPTTFPLLNL